MKKTILIVGVSLAIVASAAVVVSGMGGHHEAPVDWSSRRGQESYYASDVLTHDLKDINVNLKGTDAQRYLWIGISVSYRLGPEIKDAKSPFAKAESDLRDRLTLLLSNKTLADLDGLEKKRVLKQEILDQCAQAVFPDRMGRVEEVYFRNFLIQ